jgi:hypothetical protein
MAAQPAVVSVNVNVRPNVTRALCALAMVAGLALAGCSQPNSGGAASGSTPGDPSASAGAGSPSPGSAGGGNTSGGGGGGGGSGTSGSGGGTGTVPKPGAPPECTDLASAPALHTIGDTLDQMDTPTTAAAAKATLQADAAQLNTIASRTGNATLKTRLTSLASAIDAVANSGTDNMGTMMGFVTALTDVSQTVQDVCGIGIG